MKKHSEFSEALADEFEKEVLAGEAATWEDIGVHAAIGHDSGYGVAVWGEIEEDGTKSFSVALRRNAPGGLVGAGKDVFSARAPLDDAYEGLLTAIDKVSAFFEQSLKAPSVNPIFPGFPYGSFTQEVMQPLLDALNKGDFKLAAELTPSKYRLCGYQEFAEDHVHQQCGYGWAGQFEDTLIPPGRYPVFASKYTYNEAKKCYQNDLKDFQGLSTYLCGNCISDSNNRRPEEYPFPNTVWESPYCHAVAHSILEDKSSIHLIEPFEAVPVHFEYNGEDCVTYDIVDRSLPEQMTQDPMSLRNKSDYIRETLDLSEKGKGLYDAFILDYTYRADFYGGCIPMNVLVKHKDYSPESFQELITKGLIQRRDCEGIAYELSASKKLHLFQSYQMHLSDSQAYRLKDEYNRVEKEAGKKPALSDQIKSASSRSSVSQHSDPAPIKLPGPDR